jgi:hypothetical protein
MGAGCLRCRRQANRDVGTSAPRRVDTLRDLHGLARESRAYQHGLLRQEQPSSISSGSRSPAQTFPQPERERDSRGRRLRLAPNLGTENRGVQLFGTAREVKDATAHDADAVYVGAVTVIGRILEGFEGTGAQGVALFTYLRYLFPLPPLLEPLPRSTGYRIRRLGLMAEEEQIREWVLAIDRGQSILGSGGLALLLPFIRRRSPRAIP